MIRPSFALAAIALSVAPASAPYAQEQPEPSPPSYQPEGQWRLTKLADGCSVNRDFLHGEDRITLGLKRIHPASDVQFAVIGGDFERGSATVQAGFIPGEEPRRFTRVASANLGEREGFVFAGPLFDDFRRSEQMERASAVTHFEFSDADRNTVVLGTRGIDQAVAALDRCVTDMLGTAGLNLEAHGGFLRHARPEGIAEWASELQRNYPRSAERGGLSGPVPVRLIVDDQGRVTRCDVTNYLTAKVLRDTACNLLVEHAKFTPALDAAGEPTTDFYTTRILYTLRQSGFSAGAHGFLIRHD